MKKHKNKYVKLEVQLPEENVISFFFRLQLLLGMLKPMLGGNGL